MIISKRKLSHILVRLNAEKTRANTLAERCEKLFDENELLKKDVRRLQNKLYKARKAQEQTHA